eukprot:CAMPEP_0198129038 /NCGR_PEP_ID=MMETSP1442-20131203/50765_1 /TAXON_ID= /ORGANISM="Craspedostauros australis, Strain CCMP3328" /LENGTH=41 /DNA_ID= /DNA_START= /DNA_END= /DNA_ORIENTATION=
MLQADTDLLPDGGHVSADIFATDSRVSFRGRDHARQHADRR